MVPVRPEFPVGAELTALAQALGLPAPGQQALVTGVTLRDGFVRPGDLFAALPGSAAHGARFARAAIEAGAVAVLTDAAGADLLGPSPVPVLVVPDPRQVLGAVAAQVHGHPGDKLTVIGVTGTSGKTTTTFLMDAGLQAAGIRTALIGTVQTRIDGVVTPSSLTTPEAPDLQALLARMVEVGVQVVLMEVSSHSLLLGRVSGIRFAVGAFTNLSQDHLDFHPDMESYFAAKELLFDGRSAAEVVMVDDEWGRRLVALHPEAITVGTTPDTDAGWAVLDLRPIGIGRQQFDVRDPHGQLRTVDVALPGPFNVANAALALAGIAAAQPEVDLDAAAAGLADVIVPGRMERVDVGQDFVVVVDYAHKPGALEAVLRAGSQGLTGRLVVVIGAGGDRDRGKRQAMGEIAAAWADLVIVTDDNPRSEDPAVIRAAVVSGAHGPVQRARPGSAQIREIGSRADAIAQAIAAAGPGDLVVVAGKGHELGQEIHGVVHPFSDTDTARSVLAGLGHRQTPEGSRP